MVDDPILSDLQYAMETSQELDILNFHKSFPITCKARVESIHPDHILLRVQPPGSVCLVSEQFTILLSRGLPEAVRARIVSFDLINAKLKLTDFEYVGSRFGERMIARVQPDGQIPVKILVGDKVYEGDLIDLSLSGIGIASHSGEFQKNQLVELKFSLPDDKVSLPGKILNITEVQAGFRLSIGFLPDAQEISVIMRYIKDRRKEILAEVEKLYQETYSSKQAQAKIP